MAKLKSTKERFEDRIERIPECGCWIWTGLVDEVRRAGTFSVDGHQQRAHRAAWMLYRGPIPEGKSVLHKCDVRECVNPDHLFLGTQDDNMKDMAAKGRSCFGEKSACTELTNANIVEIRERHARGEKMTKIAIDFDITSSNVSYIVSRKTWKHV